MNIIAVVITYNRMELLKTKYSLSATKQADIFHCNSK